MRAIKLLFLQKKKKRLILSGNVLDLSYVDHLPGLWLKLHTEVFKYNNIQKTTTPTKIFRRFFFYFVGVEEGG